MLTETKINRNVKKKKLNGRDNCILLCHHRVVTESTPEKKKKKKLPLRKSSKGSDVPGQGEGKPARLADPTPRGGRVFPSVGPREVVPG